MLIDIYVDGDWSYLLVTIHAGSWVFYAKLDIWDFSPPHSLTA